MKMAMGKTIDDILKDEAIEWMLGYLDKEHWNDAVKHHDSEGAFGVSRAIIALRSDFITAYKKQAGVEKD